MGCINIELIIIVITFMAITVELTLVYAYMYSLYLKMKKKLYTSSICYVLRCLVCILPLFLEVCRNSQVYSICEHKSTFIITGFYPTLRTGYSFLCRSSSIMNPCLSMCLEVLRLQFARQLSCNFFCLRQTLILDKHDLG